MRKRTKVILTLFFLLMISLLGMAYWTFHFWMGPLGTWEGTLNTGMATFRVALVLQRDSDGQSLTNFTNIDDGLYFQSFQKYSLKGRFFHGELPTGEVLNLKVDWLDKTLQGTYSQAQGSFQQAGKISPLILKRGNNFLVPRVGPDHTISKTYIYQPPQKFSDGWEVGDLTKENGDFPKLVEGMERILAETLPRIHSVLVVKNGKLVLDEYFYGYGPEIPHPLQSVTKSVFSILFGIARDKNLLETGQKLYDFFPEYRSRPGWDPQKDRITLGALLTMRGGFRCDDWKNSQACSWDMVNSSDWLDFALSQPLGHDPGRHFAYCGACLTPLSALVERQSGMSLPDFARKYLFDPLGIKQFTWMTGPGGITPVSFGLSLSPRDLAKLGYLLLKKGNWNGTQVVSSDWVNQSTTLHVARLITNKEADYGYLWWERDGVSGGKRVRVLDAWGVGGQHLFVVPGLDLVCVITGGNYKDGKLGANSLKFFQDYVLDSR